MGISQQKLISIKVTKLKNLIDLEIDFSGSPVTAILGPNGNGKSTVLHALACAYQPMEMGENHKFSNFSYQVLMRSGMIPTLK
jgi:ABC-type hemin transport system ATPase subunit